MGMLSFVCVIVYSVNAVVCSLVSYDLFLFFLVLLHSRVKIGRNQPFHRFLQGRVQKICRKLWAKISCRIHKVAGVCRHISYSYKHNYLELPNQEEICLLILERILFREEFDMLTCANVNCIMLNIRRSKRLVVAFVHRPMSSAFDLR